MKSKLNLEDSDIRERGDWADKPNSNFYVRSSIEFPESGFGLDIDKKKRDIEYGKIRQIIGSIFKEDRGYWNVLFDSSPYGTKHDDKKYCQLHVI